MYIELEICWRIATTDDVDVDDDDDAGDGVVLLMVIVITSMLPLQIKSHSNTWICKWENHLLHTS